ncbi:MAG: DUF2752 domain-containing protein [Planctomycetes bacterium]|nr:DUF2752 domain-containing protein [Planctomycetota bacterium]
MQIEEDSRQEHGQDVPQTGQAVSARGRLWAALVVLAGGAVLGTSAWLKPDERGYGTHEQLGGGPCGMLVTTGLPCPTCGMTTAFAHTVRGQWWRAFWAQPTGFVLALGTAAAVVGGMWVLLAGRWPRWNLFFVTPYRLFLGLLILLLGGWGFKLAVGLLDGTLPLRR